MAKRSITDDEIALIKAMLQRGMTTTEIQFRFNREDRPVNSGRISNISQGTYSNSKDIPAASNDALDAYLKPKPHAATAAPGPLDEGLLNSMFVKDPTGTWRFKVGESDEHECKLNFGTKHLGKWVRAVAALANNRGGYVLFGVHDKETPIPGSPDKSYAVIGMVGDEFVNADPVDFTKHLKSTLDPTPRIRHTTITLDGKVIGVLHVEQHSSRPVIATKQIPDINEGDIFFRYPGQSSRIKYSDLRAMLDQREVQAREQMLPMLQQLLELGPQRAMIANLDNGMLSDGSRKIVIDQELVDRIKFIKEGEFDEMEGAPALRLVGDVKVAATETIVERGAVTQEDIVRDFLDQINPSMPKEYLRAAIEAARVNWVPFHYFASKAGLDRKALAAFIRKSAASSARKKAFLDRVTGKTSALQKLNGTSSKFLDQILDGAITSVSGDATPSKLGIALAGMVKCPELGLQPILTLLKACTDAANTQETKIAASVVRRAICRVDELFFGQSDPAAEEQ